MYIVANEGQTLTWSIFQEKLVKMEKSVPKKRNNKQRNASTTGLKIEAADDVGRPNTRRQSSLSGN